MAAEIRVKVMTPNGDEHEIDVSPDLSVDEFLRELREPLNLVERDATGHNILWHMYSKNTGRELVPEDTLEQNGVQTGHRLNLARKTVAG